MGEERLFKKSHPPSPQRRSKLHFQASNITSFSTIPDDHNDNLPLQHSTLSDTLAFFTEESLYAGFEKVIMSEVTFAKTFLATLDKRPIKLPADHVADPRKYPGQSPVSMPKP